MVIPLPCELLRERMTYRDDTHLKKLYYTFTIYRLECISQSFHDYLVFISILKSTFEFRGNDYSRLIKNQKFEKTKYYLRIIANGPILIIREQSKFDYSQIVEFRIIVNNSSPPPSSPPSHSAHPSPTFPSFPFPRFPSRPSYRPAPPKAKQQRGSPLLSFGITLTDRFFAINRSSTFREFSKFDYSQILEIRLLGIIQNFYYSRLFDIVIVFFEFRLFANNRRFLFDFVNSK